jgi:hypothetical protein
MANTSIAKGSIDDDGDGELAQNADLVHLNLG